MMMIVSLHEQRAYAYRNGVIIGVSTISSGKDGHPTPTGIFTILQKQVEHKSNLYNAAPMPFMQRLTWDGIAMHAGNLPGYPASHGCIRLPPAFAQSLYAATSKGMTVVVTDDAAIPRVAPTPSALVSSSASSIKMPESAEARWAPEKARSGPVSIVISGADGRLVVLRNGVEIGSTAIAISDPIVVPSAYILRAIDAAGPHWLALDLPWDNKESGKEVSPGDGGKFGIPDDFKQKLRSILEAGATVVVTPDSLASGGTGKPVTLLSDEP